MSESFSNIGLESHTVGTLNLQNNLISWRDKKTPPTIKEFKAETLKSASWNVYGQRGYLRLDFTDGNWTRFDGFAQSDQQDIANQMKSKYNQELVQEKISSEGASFGDLS